MSAQQKTHSPTPPGSTRPTLEAVDSKTLYAQSLGKECQWNGGGLFSETRYRRLKKDAEIAAILDEAGVDVSAGVIEYKLMVPGISIEQKKYKSSPLISDIAYKRYMHYVDTFGAFYRFKAPTNTNLKFMTVHALPETLKVGSECGRDLLNVSWRKLRKVIKELNIAWADRGFQVQLVREEHKLTERDGVWNDFAHYHIIITSRRRSKRWKAFQDDFRRLWSAALSEICEEFPEVYDASAPAQAYMYLGTVDELERAKTYIAKPLPVPSNLDPDGVVWLHELLSHRRQFQAFGGFAEYRKELAETGDRIVHLDGFYKRITRRHDEEEQVIDPDDDGSAQEAPQEDAKACSAPDAAQTVTSTPEASQRSSRPVYNIACGPTLPRSGPGNRKESFYIVAQPSDWFLHENVETKELVHRWREGAQRIWEHETGEEFSVREYLRPRAKTLWDWAYHPDKAYRDQLKINPLILKIIEEILVEDGKMPADEDEWHGPQFGVKKLKDGDPPPF